MIRWIHVGSSSGSAGGGVSGITPAAGESAQKLLLFLLVLLLAFGGCVSAPESAAAMHQRDDADLVVNFQSWNSISFIKPDVTGAAGAMTFRPKTFRRDAFVKLLNNLKIGRESVVVVLDRRYSPDPMFASGGTQEIKRFFEGLGFRQVIFQDAN